MDYFEIFLQRMLLCRRAAEQLGLSFRLEINGQLLLLTNMFFLQVLGIAQGLFFSVTVL